jgi:hypothetical protein
MDSDDQIATLAQEFLAHGNCDASRLIDIRVDEAMRAGKWDEITKWQRVKLRVARLERARQLSQRHAVRSALG